MAAGMMPNLTSEVANTALVEATAMSQAAVRPVPPPSAAPWTRAMVGFFISASTRSILARARASFRLSSSPLLAARFIQLRSAPAEKLLPRPASTTARTSASSSSAMKAAVSSVIRVSSKALCRSGRFIQMVATGPFSSISSVVNMSRSCLLLSGADQVGHRMAAQCRDQAGLVLGRLVLADLPFADQALDDDLDANDGAEHLGDVVGRCVIDAPWMRQGGLVRGGQRVELGEQPVAVVDQSQFAIGMDCRVVPGRHDLAVLGLGGVAGGADIAVRAFENDEDFPVDPRASLCVYGRGIARQRVGAGDVA